eukprot:TRINITY_DN3065_c0_g1_i3.p1 TRINITY_DN3065_c0_g1~~TRINITY_DN3065_c0_g1_i3.p1  ORF type:complete len:297 (+),score=45.62 TRINITY_DN3065_c0_g1_i3:3-893(+)
MLSHYRPHRITHVAGLTSASTSGGHEFSHGERNLPGVNIIAGDPRAASVPKFIEDGVTTLMLTDLPYELTLADLKDELEILGFAKTYDYIFYPKERKQNFRGYCFINFVSTAEATRFAHVFVDHKFELCPSPKLSNVQESRTQGLHENLAKIRPGAARYEYRAKIKPGAARYDNFFMDSNTTTSSLIGGGFKTHAEAMQSETEKDGMVDMWRQRGIVLKAPTMSLVMRHVFGHMNACLLSFTTTSLTHAPHRSSVTFRSHVLKGSMNIVLRSSQARHITTTSSRIRSVFKTHAKEI